MRIRNTIHTRARGSRGRIPMHTDHLCTHNLHVQECVLIIAHLCCVQFTTKGHRDLQGQPGNCGCTLLLFLSFLWENCFVCPEIGPDTEKTDKKTVKTFDSIIFTEIVLKM